MGHHLVAKSQAFFGQYGDSSQSESIWVIGVEILRLSKKKPGYYMLLCLHAWVGPQLSKRPIKKKNKFQLPIRNGFLLPLDQWQKLQMTTTWPANMFLFFPHLELHATA